MSLTLLRSHTTYKGFSLLEAGKWCAAIVLGATLSQAAWGQDSLVYLPGKMYVIRITPYVDSQEVLEPLMKEKLRPLLTGADGMLDYVQQDILPMQGSAHGQWFLGVFNASRQEKDMLLRDASLFRWLTGGAYVQIMPLELVQSPISVSPPTTLNR